MHGGGMRGMGMQGGGMRGMGMQGGGMQGMGMQGPGMQGMPPGMGMMGGQVAGPGPHYYNGPAGGGSPPGQGGNVWRPTHHHTYDYKAPTDLQYPDQNQPPGVVQYPYYTVKGPTDFFFK
jgi:hypothetical protein